MMLRQSDSAEMAFGRSRSALITPIDLMDFLLLGLTEGTKQRAQISTTASKKINKRKPRQRRGFLVSAQACCLVSTPRRNPPHPTIVISNGQAVRLDQHLNDWHTGRHANHAIFEQGISICSWRHRDRPSIDIDQKQIRTSFPQRHHQP